MVLLEALGAQRWVGALSSRWMAAFYGANLVLSLGLCAVSGMWLPFLATAALLAFCASVARPRAIGERVPA